MILRRQFFGGAVTVEINRAPMASELHALLSVELHPTQEMQAAVEEAQALRRQHLEDEQELDRLEAVEDQLRNRVSELERQTQPQEDEMF